MEFNPYAPPRDASLAFVEPSQGWYTNNIYACTYAELWRLTRNPLTFGLIVLLSPLAWLGLIRPRTTFAYAPAQLGLLASDHVSAEVVEKLRPLAGAAQEIGFRFHFLYSFPMVGNLRLVIAVYLAADRQTILQLVYAKAWSLDLVNEQVTSVFSTHWESGRTIVTSSRRKELETPPQVESVHFPDLPLPELYQQHRSRMPVHLELTQPIGDDTHLLQRIRESDKRSTDFQIARRFYVPVSAIELERLRRNSLIDSKGPIPLYRILRNLAAGAILIIGLLIFTWLVINEGAAEVVLFILVVLLLIPLLIRLVLRMTR